MLAALAGKFFPTFVADMTTISASANRSNGSCQEGKRTWTDRYHQLTSFYEYKYIL